MMHCARLAGATLLVLSLLCADGFPAEGFVERDGARLTLHGREYRALE
jgi:hypothetical protein